MQDELNSKPDGNALRAPGGWLPILLAAASAAVLAGYLATGPHDPTMVIENGVARPDEGPAARVWQMLMFLQLPAIAMYAVRWLPRDPRRTVGMLALQATAFAAAASPVFWLGL